MALLLSNATNTEIDVRVTRRRSDIIPNSLIKHENEENLPPNARKRGRKSVPDTPSSQILVKPRSKKAFHPSRPTYTMMVEKLNRKWKKNKYTKNPEDKQDQSIVDFKIDVEVATRSSEGCDHWDRLTCEMGKRDQYEFDYIVCITSRKLREPLPDQLLIKWHGYPRPTWELKKTISAGIEIEMSKSRQEDVDFIELKLRSILGDDAFERLFPFRYLQYEAGVGMGGYVENERSIYINILRSIEWRWNYVNKRSNQPLIYIEDWTDEPQDYESLLKFDFANYLSNSKGVDEILKQHNHQLDHKKCSGGRCATCMTQSKQGKEHSHCCGMKYSVGVDKDGHVKWENKRGDLVIDVNIECTSECECGPKCKNKALTNGRQSVLCVFREPGKGWGVRTVQEMPKSTFVSEYTGEMCLNSLPESDPKWIFDFQMQFDVRDVNGKKVHDPLVISAGNKGNETRFFNHACDPNMTGITFIVERHGIWYCHIGFFTTKKIDAGEELTFDYFPKKDASAIRKMFNVCRCGFENCRLKTEINKEAIEEKDDDKEKSRDLAPKKKRRSSRRIVVKMESVEEENQEEGE